MANGYVRGALEHAAAAWLPAASHSHVELIERELRAAARAVTGCVLSTPSHALMAEAGLPTAGARRTVLATRMLALASSLPEGDPLRMSTVPPATRPRLSKVTGWRDIGRTTLAELGVLHLPIDQRLRVTLPPWTQRDHVTITSTIDDCSRSASEESRRLAAEKKLDSLPSPDSAIWIWSDGSADGGVSMGGGGALILLPGGDKRELRVPAGRLCSSTHAELVALRAALAAVLELDGPVALLPVVACLDSRAALLLLEGGPAAQTSGLGAAIWELLLSLTERGRCVHLQWVPAHCGILENEQADSLAKEASALEQSSTPLEASSVTRAAARLARKQWRLTWPDGWFKDIFRERLPGPIRGDDRGTAVDVHQLRAGHWSASEQWLHRIGRSPSPDCAGCADPRCPAALCRVCREEADTPRHVLLRCPSLCGRRLRILGSIHAQAPDMTQDDVVASLAAGFRSLRSRLATPRP